MKPPVLKAAAIQMASGPNVSANLLEVERLAEGPPRRVPAWWCCPRTSPSWALAEADTVGDRASGRRRARSRSSWPGQARAPRHLDGGRHRPARVSRRPTRSGPPAWCFDASGRASRATTRSTCSTSPSGRRRRALTESRPSSRATGPASSTRPSASSGWPSATTCASPSCSGACSTRAWTWSPCPRPSPRSPAAPTGRRSSGPARSRTSATSIAAAQGGYHVGGRETYGHSMIVDPWGVGPGPAAAGPRRRHRRPGPGVADGDASNFPPSSTAGCTALSIGPSIPRHACQRPCRRRPAHNVPQPDADGAHDTSPRHARRACSSRPGSASRPRPGAGSAYVGGRQSPTCTSRPPVSSPGCWRTASSRKAAINIEQGVGVRAIAGEKTGLRLSDEIVLPALMRGRRRRPRHRRPGRHGHVQAWPRRRGAAPSTRALDPGRARRRRRRSSCCAAVEAEARRQDPRITQVIVSLAGEHDVCWWPRSDGTLGRRRPPAGAPERHVHRRGERPPRAGQRRRRRPRRLRRTCSSRTARSASRARRPARRWSTSTPSTPRPATMTVVLGPGWPGVLLHEAIGHGLEGDFNRKGTSAFAGRIGQRVALAGVHGGRRRHHRRPARLAQRRRRGHAHAAHRADRERHPARLPAGPPERAPDGRGARPATAGARATPTCRCRA